VIEYVKGQVKVVKDQAIILEIGGVALALAVPMSSLFLVEESVQVWTHVHWNQENGPSLFGFKTEFERQIFLLVTSCSGIGPKIALSILAELGPNNFINAINSGDDKALSKVNGIGPKKAEQIVVQLKHKVAKLVTTGAFVADSQGSAHLQQWHNVSEVLSSLHYTRTEIAAAMKYVSENNQNGENSSFDLLVRQALSFLAKRA
jgi:Holliday junction DNA helicase RuvA